MSGAIVAIAERIGWPVAVLMLWAAAAAFSAAQHCPLLWLAELLLDFGSMCSRGCRAMLTVRRSP